jgi:hypothetical protein
MEGGEPSGLVRHANEEEINEFKKQTHRKLNLEPIMQLRFEIQEDGSGVFIPPNVNNASWVNKVTKLLAEKESESSATVHLARQRFCGT